MLIRLFLIGFILVLVGRTVRTFVGGVQKKQPQTSPTPLVADPVCGLYIDRDQAIPARGPSGETVYFCSRDCRDKYLSPHPDSSPEVPPGERRSG